MYTRILKEGLSSSFFLFGPRGVGKSSWVKERFPTAIYIDLLDSYFYTQLLASPSRLSSMIPDGSSSWVVIDEVQRIPAILDEVHRLIENRKLKFVLTGSSARKLKKEGANLLAGRALSYSMHPLTVGELGADFSLSHSLRFGHLPKVYGEGKSYSGEFLKSYVSTYLREEVLQEGLARNIAAFARFLEAASFSQGSVLNISQVASDCSVNRKVVEDYFYIAEDLLIAKRLPVFCKRAKRKIVAHPKFYFFDVGVYRAIRPKGPLDLVEEIEGQALETLFYQELRALNDYLTLEYEIFYWRTQAKEEVDFVLYGERGIKAFEIKRSAHLRDEDFRGLKLLSEDYPMASTFMIYGGDREEKRYGIRIIPYEKALRELGSLI